MMLHQLEKGNNMSQLYTISPGFNPYHVDVNNKTYVIRTIMLYKKDQSIISTNNGWFGNNNNVSTLIIPTVILRRKPKIDGKTFIIVNKRNVFTRLNTYSEVDLYIPFEYFDFEITQTEENHGYYSYVYQHYISKKNNQIDFIDYTNRTLVEDESKKSYAKVLLATINAIESELDLLKEEYEHLDDKELLKKLHWETPLFNTMAAAECKQTIVKAKHYFKVQ